MINNFHAHSSVFVPVNYFIDFVCVRMIQYLYADGCHNFSRIIGATTCGLFDNLSNQ